MSEGPFGFNRPFGLGPFTSSTPDDKSAEELYIELTLRSHSLRNYDPREFRYMKDQGVSKKKLREELRIIESARFEPILDKTHRMFVHLDEDERRDFARNNPGIMDWVSVWADLEDQATFEEYL